MPVILLVVLIVPSGGIGWCSSIASCPCTSIAGLKVPILPNAPPPMPTITAKVGSTCCGTPEVFSVVNGSSFDAGTDAHGVEQAVLRGPRRLDGLGLGSDGVGVDGHRSAAPVSVRCSAVASSPSMPAFGRAFGKELGDDRAHVRGVVDRLDARTAVPALGDREHSARRLEDAPGDARRTDRSRAT